jgi:hypothetical protein
VSAAARGARAVAALVGLTLRESARQRLWVIFVVVAIALAVATARLSAIDQSSRLKLAVVIVTTGLGFAATLLAMLVGASQLRRDLDARVGMMLFAKPLPRLAYLGGRFLGVVAGIGIGGAALALVGSAMIAWRFGGSPDMRRVAMPDHWTQVSALGQELPVKADQPRLALSGASGNAVRFHFSGLPRPGPEGIELLLRADARSLDPGEQVERAEVEALASPDGAAFSVLELDPASPYGHAEGIPPGHLVARARDESHQDLSQDYARLRLPAGAISPSGEAWVQILRLDGRCALVFDRASSLQAAVPGGSFLLNVERAAAVLLAQAALLCAFTLLVACVSSIGVALFGGMTLYFAGNALWALKDTLLYGDPGRATQRLIGIALAVTPDFDRFGVAAQLAAGHAVGWEVVGAAWAYYGAFAAVFLGAAWVALSRREL